MFEPKIFQTKALESLKDYLERAKRLGDPKTAFIESWSERGRPSVTRWHLAPGLGNIPYVCIRIPTGGGKTWLAARSLRIVRDSYTHTQSLHVLWLVPSQAILEQTLSALSTAGHPYREELVEAWSRPLVVTREGLEAVSPQDFASRLVVVVATIQSFKAEDTGTRTIYAHSERWERHFAALSGIEGLELSKEGSNRGKPIHSFVNLCRVFKPLIIIDEAHNARSKLSFDTLARLSPFGILEYTATPDTSTASGSNVLHEATASELKAEKMIKLPIVLAQHSSWATTVAEAVRTRNALEEAAKAMGDLVRPITLYQAQAKDKNDPTVITADKLRDHLIQNEGIDPTHIAVATGDERGIEGVNLYDPTCPIRHIITIQALKEGWDCSFAYVFCSIQELKSPRAIEQLLGRVLRMPYAQERPSVLLNKAYAHVSSRDFAETASALKDCLVDKMGFERIEAEVWTEVADFFPDEGSGTIVGLAPDGQSISIPAYAPLDFWLFAPEPGLLVESAGTRADGVPLVRVSGSITEATITKLAETLGADSGGERTRAIARNLANYRLLQATMHRVPPAGPDAFKVGSLFAHDEVSGELIPVDEGWFVNRGRLDLSDASRFSARLTPEEFSIPVERKVTELDVVADKVITRNTRYDRELFTAEVSSEFYLNSLVFWLDRRLARSDVSQLVLQDFLSRLIHHLTDERKLFLGDLILHKYLLEEKIRLKLDAYRLKAASSGLESLLDLPELDGSLEWEADFSFSKDRCPYPQAESASSYGFSKHFFPVVDNLRRNGEEFDCAKEIDALDEVETWVRNVPPRHQWCFRLPTSRDDFYPDFVAKLKDGRILVIEYKGAHLASDPAEREKRRVGELWARVSKGKGLFVWAMKRDDTGRGVRQQLNTALIRK
ncbi:MAG: type III restriction enzyme Res subunit [Spirochaetes bacterium]|nr:MAG: type III restriction enzyme Res subunit [Spirochaetota bacterium]